MQDAPDRLDITKTIEVGRDVPYGECFLVRAKIVGATKVTVRLRAFGEAAAVEKRSRLVSSKMKRAARSPNRNDKGSELGG